MKIFVLFCISFTMMHLFNLREGNREPYLSAIFATIPLAIIYLYTEYKYVWKKNKQNNI